jgi:hypothetical protein
MANIVLPLNISFKEWASQIRIDLPQITFPVPDKVEYWRDWASQVVYSNYLNNVPLPTEISYPNTEDWKKWGAFFVNYLYNNPIT